MKSFQFSTPWTKTGSIISTYVKTNISININIKQKAPAKTFVEQVKRNETGAVSCAIDWEISWMTNLLLKALDERMAASGDWLVLVMHDCPHPWPQWHSDSTSGCSDTCPRIARHVSFKGRKQRYQDENPKRLSGLVSLHKYLHASKKRFSMLKGSEQTVQSCINALIVTFTTRRNMALAISFFTWYIWIKKFSFVQNSLVDCLPCPDFFWFITWPTAKTSSSVRVYLFKNTSVCSGCSRLLPPLT